MGIANVISEEAVAQRDVMWCNLAALQNNTFVDMRFLKGFRKFWTVSATTVSKKPTSQLIFQKCRLSFTKHSRRHRLPWPDSCSRDFSRSLFLITLSQFASKRKNHWSLWQSSTNSSRIACNGTLVLSRRHGDFINSSDWSLRSSHLIGAWPRTFCRFCRSSFVLSAIWCQRF